MACPVLACVCKCRRSADRNSSAVSRAQSAAGRVDLWPLDHGSHESGTLRVGESTVGRVPVQGIRRRPRAACAMVQAGDVGVVGGSRFGRVFMALGPLQRQAVSRLERILARSLSAGNDRAVACARGFICQRMEERGHSNVSRPRRQDLWSRVFAGDSAGDVHGCQPQLLSGHQPRYRRTHGCEPA